MGDEGEFAVEYDLEVFDVVLYYCFTVLVEYALDVAKCDCDQVEEDIETNRYQEAVATVVVGE